MQIVYNATKTASTFHHDNSFIRLLFGPVGCGKSVADVEEVFIRAQQQEPGHDGVRRSRWAITRNTYPELKATTIKTWTQWFPEEVFGKIKYDSPITHRIFLPNFDLEVIFLPLDNLDEAIKKLKSFELTGVYFNELQFVHKKVFEEALDRVNRYPPKMSGAKITWTGVIADTNPPSTRHWIYKTFEIDKPKGYKIFKYEPALLKVDQIPTDGTPYAQSLEGTIYINNPDADYRYVQNDPDYWLKLVPGKTDEVIKVSYCGEYGLMVDGRPVHPEYKDRFHYAAKPLEYLPDVELGLGWDFGLTPSCIVVQQTSRGQLIVIAEFYNEDMGLRDFAENIVIPYLNQHFPEWKKNYRSRHDPAGQTGSQTDMKNCQQILKELGIISLPAAPNNAPTPRRDGLKYHLRRLVDGEPGFLLSSNCPILREGLMGHFQYAPIRTSNTHETRYHEKPLKNMYSHPCEALEYIAMSYAIPKIEKKDESQQVIKQMAQRFNEIQQLRAS